MTTPLILREGQPARLVELPRPVADALSAAGVVKVAMTERSGWWEVTPGTSIGVVNVGGQQVVIEPKIDINRLVFLMGYARNPDFWRDEQVRVDADADLPEALADAFVRLARRALEQGLLKGYVTVEETLPVLRGRVREADQLRRRWGRSIPLEVRYDEFTVDIAENQVLLAAAPVVEAGQAVAYRHPLQLTHAVVHRMQGALDTVLHFKERLNYMIWGTANKVWAVPLFFIFLVVVRGACRYISSYLLSWVGAVALSRSATSRPPRGGRSSTTSAPTSRATTSNCHKRSSPPAATPACAA